MATWVPHAVWWPLASSLQGSLMLSPTAYPTDYANCIADHPVCGTNCLAVSHCGHCSLNPGEASCELRGWKETWGAKELQAHLFSAGWHNSSNTAFLLAGSEAIAVFSLGWCSSHKILSSCDWSNRHSHDITVKPWLYGWSSHICVLHTTCEQVSTSWQACAVL